MTNFINKARSYGKSTAEIEDFLRQKEEVSLYIAKPEEVNRFLGRTPETMKRVYETRRESRLSMYEKAKPDMKREEIDETMTMASILGLSESVLLNNKGLRIKLSKEYNLRKSFFQEVADAKRREDLNYELAIVGNEAITKQQNREQYEKQISELQKELEKVAPSRMLTGWRSWASPAAEVGYQQIRQIGRALPAALAAGATGAAAALLVGNAGPQAAVPEELVTLPVASLKMGVPAFKAKLAYDAYRRESGAIAADLMMMRDENNQPMPMEIIGNAASVAGLVNAAVEFVGEEAFLALFPGGRSVFREQFKRLMGSSSFVRRIVGIGAAWQLSTLAEVAEEIVQETAGMMAEQYARSESGQPFAGGAFDDAGKRYRQIAEQTYKGALIIGAPGAAANIALKPKQQPGTASTEGPQQATETQATVAEALAAELDADPNKAIPVNSYGDEVRNSLIKHGNFTPEQAEAGGLVYNNYVGSTAAKFGISEQDVHRLTIQFGEDPENRARVDIGDKGTAIITLFENADFSSFVHELAHIALDDMRRFAPLAGANEQSKADLKTVYEFLGLDENAEFTEEAQEKWAHEAETYFGQPPITHFLSV
jgi:hypothetical protein